VLRASGADADGIEKKMEKTTMKMIMMKERRMAMKADVVWTGEGKPGAIT
jgi:hypothetical protein